MSEADAAQLAQRVGAAMWSRDRAARELGMRLEAVGPGTARLSLTVSAAMLNGHAVCHGGLIFALADTAFAYACNSHNGNAVAAAASIDFLAPAREGDVLTATAREIWRSRRSGLSEIEVTNQRGERIALFRGRSSRIAGEVIQPAG